MPSSGRVSEEWQGLDLEVLRNGGISRYRREDYLREDVLWLAEHGYDVYELDCQRWASENEMYSEIARVLRFADWWGPKWGRNLDALQDILSELPLSGIGAAVVLRRLDGFARGSGSALAANGRTRAWALLDVLARTSRFLLVAGKRLIILIQTDDRSLNFQPVAAVLPAWNRREWLEKNVLA